MSTLLDDLAEEFVGYVRQDGFTDVDEVTRAVRRAWDSTIDQDIDDLDSLRISDPIPDSETWKRTEVTDVPAGGKPSWMVEAERIVSAKDAKEAADE